MPTKLAPPQLPPTRSTALIDSSRNEDLAKADALRFQETSSREPQKPLNEAEAKRRVQEALDSAAARRDHERGRRAAEAVRDGIKDRSRGAATSVVQRTLAAAEAGVINLALRIPVAGTFVGDERARFDLQLESIESADLSEIALLSPPGQTALLLDDVAAAVRGKNQAKSIAAQRIRERARERDRDRANKRKRRPESVGRPCPVPGRRCADGSRCGGRAASVRGPTSGYDS